MRLVLSGIFLYLAAVGIADPRTCAEAVADYRVLPPQLVGLAALYLPWLALCSSLGLLLRWTSSSAALLLALLSAAGAVAQGTAAARGLWISCGTLGGARSASYSNFVLWLVLLAACLRLLLRGSLDAPVLPAWLRAVWRAHWPAVAAAGVVATVFYWSNPDAYVPHDYTALIARQLVHGRLGTLEEPPNWLNEMVPRDGRYYSVLPLGGSLIMLPVAMLQEDGVLGPTPSGAIVASVAAVTFLLAYALAVAYRASRPRRWLMALFPVLGTCFWANLALGGCWHINSGMGTLGQLMALVFILGPRRPVLAGLGLALAFGSRAQLVLAAPAFMLMIWVESGQRRPPWRDLAAFCAVPLGLGLLTMAYNYARWGHVTEYGYRFLPALVNDPNFIKHGLFSIGRAPINLTEMLLSGWRRLPGWPYYVPTGWGGSLFLSSPYLVYLFRPGARSPRRKLVAIFGALTIWVPLLCYCAAGGWQFSYRYFMDLLPWVLVILHESARDRPSWLEWLLFGLSVAVNAWGTWLMIWSGYVRA